MATGDSCDPNTAVIRKYHSCHTRKWLCLLASVISQHHHQEFQNLKDLMFITILPGHDIKKTTFYKLSLKVYTYNKHSLTKYIIYFELYHTKLWCFVPNHLSKQHQYYGIQIQVGLLISPFGAYSGKCI